MSEAELKGGTDISVCRPFLAGGRVLVPRGASARVPTVPGCHASKVIVLWLVCMEAMVGKQHAGSAQDRPQGRSAWSKVAGEIALGAW